MRCLYLAGVCKAGFHCLDIMWKQVQELQKTVLLAFFFLEIKKKTILIVTM